MSFNYVPMFANMGHGASGIKQPSNFMSQLVAVMQSNAGGTTNTFNKTASLNATACTSASAAPSSSSAAYYTRKRHSITPEPPPAPRLSECIEKSTRIVQEKPNQGALPMDLDNDCELEAAQPTEVQPNLSTQQQLIKGPSVDSNLMLNALMSGGVNPSAASYMFFPTAAGSVLMDPSSMMAAAMQQMQQGYSGYMAAGTEGNAVTPATEGATEPTAPYTGQSAKEIIKTKHCILFPPNPNGPPPTIRDRPPGCRTVFVGGLPEVTTEEIIREIFESCGEISTLRMSKKNFCHIRYRHESSIDRAIFLSGYRVRVSITNDPANFGRLHVDFAQARDDQYDYECKQRQQQREQRHRDRSSLDRRRSQSPPPIPHYSDHEASMISESLRSNDTFVKAVQTVSIWLERGDCSKRNANIFYSMIQSTHAHVRRLHSEKQQLEEDLKKAREIYRKQMLVMSKQFTQIEKVFNAASHKKVWDHFSKAQRKNIDQWKKLATELRCIQIEDDEMEMSDEDRDAHSNHKRSRYDTEHLKDENDSLRCQLEAIRNEMSLERTDIKYDSDFREKQIKVLQETIRNMQTQLLQTKAKEQKDIKTIEQLERKLKESGVKQLLLKTKIRHTTEKLKDRENSSRNSEGSEIIVDDMSERTGDELKMDGLNERESKRTDGTAGEEGKGKESFEKMENNKKTWQEDCIDLDKIPDDIIEIVENQSQVVEIAHIHEGQIIDGGRRRKREGVKNFSPQKSANINSAEDSKQAQQRIGKAAPEIVAATESQNTNNSLLHMEARIIALVTAFLVVHPRGVSSDYIYDYLCDFIKSSDLNAAAVTDILNKYENLFKPTPSNTEANTEEQSTASKDNIVKWNFIGYTTDQETASLNEKQIEEKNVKI